MTLIAVLITIVFLLFGYYIMDRIDKFIVNNNNFSNEALTDVHANNEKNKHTILIYGNNQLTTLVKDYCNSQEYKYESITEISHIGADYKYSCLFALSFNDSDNLMISTIGLKIYSIPKVISLCNSRENLKIYNEFELAHVLQNTGTTEVFDNIKEILEKHRGILSN